MDGRGTAKMVATASGLCRTKTTIRKADCLRQKVVVCATKACKLTNEQDWVCFDTLGVAHAETGDFDAAITAANKAIELAPTEIYDAIKQRIALYQKKKPNRLE